LPFCSQPWSTIYVQWDGKVTRPCIRGPQNLGALDDTDLLSFWNGNSFRAVRAQVSDEVELSQACSSCFHERGRVIDHITPFADNVDGFSNEKIANFYRCRANYTSSGEVLDNAPTVLLLDISAKCNVRCLKCFVYNSEMQYALGHMSEATFAKIVPLLSTALLVIGHENGESLLNKNFMKFVRVIKENGCRFSFNTTGQLLTEAKSREIVELGVEQIMFSIDSLDEQLYAKMHKGGTLNKLLGNLKCLNMVKAEQNSRLPLIGWYFVGCRSNIAEVPHIVSQAIDLGFSSFFFSHLNMPTSEQWPSYHQYYENENLRGTDADRKLFFDAVEFARAKIEGNNMEFFSASI